MDLVLGLSVTSTAVRWVLVEGVTGDGDAIDRGALDIVDGIEFDAEALLTVLLDANDAVIENGLHAVGVTWTPAGEVIAAPIIEALQERGVQNAISVSESEAAEALASGIADIAGYENVAVCVFEPGYTLVAVVNAVGVSAEPQDLADDVELAASVIALDLNDRQLDAIFVVGSADLDPVVASMDTVAAAPVISAAEADMAMSRGAAVASAMAVNALAGDPTMMMRLRGMSKTSVLASVLVAAGVTLVISLSVALGLQATPDSPSEAQNASATGEQIKEMTAPSKARAAMAAPKLEQRPAGKPLPAARPAAPEPAAPVPAGPPVAQTMVAVPSAPAAVPDADVPAYVPPAPAYVPPAPAYTPPPAYVPPQPQVPAVQPEPRLRDKIIERIPIINRFHDPQPMYPPG